MIEIFGLDLGRIGDGLMLRPQLAMDPVHHLRGYAEPLVERDPTAAPCECRMIVDGGGGSCGPALMFAIRSCDSYGYDESHFYTISEYPGFRKGSWRRHV